MLMQAMTMDSRELADAPYVIRRGLMFPYEEGTEFVTRIHDRDGWEGINRAFRKPPQSTEQIMHPERYIDQLDEPVEVRLPRLGRRLRRDWTLVEDNVMGELNTQILFRRHLGNWRSRKPSRGWDGDRFRVYRNPDDGSMIMVWSTVWDSGKDADEFFDAYALLIPQKYPEAEFDERGDTDWMLWSSPGLTVFLGKTGTHALTIEAPTQGLMSTVLSRFRNFRELGGDFTGGSE
jgi:hypothetical protein